MKKIQEGDDYVIALNSYQCSNIRWLCNAIGYPYPNANAIEPFHFANTGDWLGELHNLVEDGCGDVRPNCSIDSLQDSVSAWLAPYKRAEALLRDLVSTKPCLGCSDKQCNYCAVKERAKILLGV